MSPNLVKNIKKSSNVRIYIDSDRIISDGRLVMGLYCLWVGALLWQPHTIRVYGTIRFPPTGEKAVVLLRSAYRKNKAVPGIVRAAERASAPF